MIAPKRTAGGRRPQQGRRPCHYLQILLPERPLHLLEQQSEFTVHEAPAGLQLGEHAGLVLQFESAQSTRPSQSLSIPSVQTSVVGVQPDPRKGSTEVQ